MKIVVNVEDKEEIDDAIVAAFKAKRENPDAPVVIRKDFVE